MFAQAVKLCVNLRVDGSKQMPGQEEVGHDPEETDMIGRDGSNRGRGRRGGRGFSRGRSSQG
eukprot:scaffold148437_cov15-Tisochrysis_lutea.AAC.1